MGSGQSAVTRQAAVIGHPIDHSLSPVLHRAAYDALGLDWSYTAVDVTADEVVDFVAGRDESWVGLSVTAPLKQAILPTLDRVSPLARRVGAVNTVLFAGDGSRSGDNTDVAGILSALDEVRSVGDVSTLAIIGAGGTAAAALVAAHELGVEQVLVCARRMDAAQQLVQAVSPGAPQVLEWSDRDAALDADVVIVTLPGDAAAGLVSDLPLDPGILLDVTYSPWPTTLAAAWQETGGAVAGGHRMLLWQAVEQVRLMTGLEPPVAAMDAALQRALSG